MSSWPSTYCRNRSGCRCRCAPRGRSASTTRPGIRSADRPAMMQSCASHRPQLAERLRGPGRTLQRHLPERRGRLLLPAPEWFSRGTEGQLAFRLPARRVGPAGHRRAIRQMRDQRNLGRLDRPGDVERLGQPGHPAARLKPRGQGRAGVEPIALVVKGSRAAAWINVRLQYGHVQPRLCQQSGSGEAADACADHNNSVHFPHSSFKLPVSVSSSNHDTQTAPASRSTSARRPAPRRDGA